MGTNRGRDTRCRSGFHDPSVCGPARAASALDIGINDHLVARPRYQAAQRFQPGQATGDVLPAMPPERPMPPITAPSIRSNERG